MKKSSILAYECTLEELKKFLVSNSQYQAVVFKNDVHDILVVHRYLKSILKYLNLIEYKSVYLFPDMKYYLLLSPCSVRANGIEE